MLHYLKYTPLSTRKGEEGRVASTRTPFEKLTAIHPERRITLETGATPIATRLMDLFVPLGFGQRALVVAPPQAGKTTILRQLAAAVIKNYPESSLFLCLVDERPEEVTEWRTEVQGPEVKLYASSFDQASSRHGRVVEQALNDAKRQVEQGKDVVILLDSLTRLARAHNLNSDMWAGPRNQRGGYGSRTLSGGVDARALEVGRRVFGAARTIEEGGSLTIVASCLVETGSRLDEVVYEEFKGTGNLEIRLSRELADRRIFPAVDIAASSTRQEERLLSPEELRAMAILRRKLADLPRREITEQVINLFEKTSSNARLVEAVLNS
ncbi:MAG TPA: transcription termination factor Rho [Ktedonobacteraceae bacterium]|nr:transcription termination factor Rho [Ktedonobacteraceae bacterium]